MHADRFTIKTQEALQAALALAPQRRHAQVTPLHLLAALLDQEGGIVTPLLGKIGTSAGALREEVQGALAGLPTLATQAEPTTAPELLAVLRAAEREMRELKDEYVSVEHVLLALSGHGSKAGEALRAAGVTKDQLLRAVLEVRGPHRVTDDAPPVSDYAAMLVEGVVSHRDRIDQLLAEHAEGWTVARMPAVDRNLLRIGVFELLWVDEIDDPVAITEAVELARTLSTDDSPRFLNGVLSRIADLADHLRTTR